MTSATILGCEGLVLTEKERAFFREADPYGFILFARNVATPDQLRGLTSALRDVMGRDVPILIDQEGGRVQRMTPPHWTQFLPPMEQVQRAGERFERAVWLRSRLIAAELFDVGIDVNCAPCCDVARPETHPFLLNRCFGTDAEPVARAAPAVMAGQAAGGVLSVIKHIPGHGRAVVDSHHELPSVDLSHEQLSKIDFAPFKALRDAPFAMTGHIVFPQIDAHAPATTSATMIGLIRDEMGFGGLLMSDDVSMQALSGSIADRAAASRAAGCDAVLHCNGQMPEMEAVVAAAGTFSTAEAARAQAALDQRAQPDEVDIRALRAELKALEETGAHV